MNALRAAGPLRVLVVDDHQDAADSLCQLLTLWGHQPMVAYGPAAALELARAWPPDAVLLDLVLPGMSGWELARLLRADPKLAGVLLAAVTGLSQPADLEQSRAAGLDCHLLKPVEPELLSQLLAAHAARRAGLGG